MRITNRNDKNQAVEMPDIMKIKTSDEVLYRCFMQRMQGIPTSRMEIKILAAIQFTADTLEMSDAHVSKILVEAGMRAPRLAFPIEFLEYADKTMMRYSWEVGAPSEALRELKDFWMGSSYATGNQDGFRHVSSILQEDLVSV